MSVGGIRSGEQALQRISEGGADLVQIYTPVVTEGPQVVSSMLEEMKSLMRERGISDIN